MSDSADSHPAATHEYYSIETIAEITGTSKHTIAVYCRHGILSPIGQPEEEGWTFDDEAILRLRHIEQWRAELGMNLEALRFMTSMMNELEDLRREIRFLRGR